MNPSRSLKLIRERFSACTEKAPGIFRAELQYEGKPRSILFFDFNENSTVPGFDLSAYLQTYLAPDFYQNEGSLQWNYYLYFVLAKEKFKVLEESGLAHKIELERTFARKFVRDEEWFLQDLSGNLSTTLFKGEKPKDIASHWVEELNNAGLGKIADLTTAYTTIVDDYVKGRTPESVLPIKAKAEERVENGKFLKHLEIRSFRKHPLKTTYAFGQVNLIRGVNGSGKTSLLEAIELGICGGIRRQGGKIPSKATLMLKFDGDSQFGKAPLSDPTHYRTIDAAWYGGYYRKVNKLYENFGRFNFFDADAGFRLSHGESAAAIREAIEALFLGEYANSLESIMERCKGGFEVKQREFKQRLTSLGSEEAKIESDLATVRRINNTSDTLLAELNSKAKSVGWISLPTKVAQANLVEMTEAIEEICALLGNSLRNLPWLPKLSINLLNEELAKLKTALKELSAKYKERDLSTKNSEKLEETISLLSEKLILLTKLAAYHTDESGFKLLGLGEGISSKRAEYDTLREVTTLLKGLNLGPLENSQGTITANLKKLEMTIAAKKRSISEKRQAIENIKRQSSEIFALVEEIKGLGKHLCEQTPDIKDCPLCGAVYKTSLLERIESFKPDKSIDDSMRELTSAAATEEKELGIVQVEKATVEQVQRAASLLLSESQLSTKTMKSISSDLVGTADKVIKAKADLDALISLERRLKLQGLTEKELTSIIDEIEVVHGLSEVQATKSSVVNNLLEKEKKALETAKKDQKAAETLFKALTTQISNLVKKTIGNTDVDEPSVEMERRIANVQNALLITKTAKDYMSLLPNMEFAALRDQLKALSEAATRIGEALKQIHEKDALEKKWVGLLDTVKKSTAQYKSRSERVTSALNILNRLLNSENKHSYLSTMLTSQKDKLASIFGQIHSPKEFDEVKLNGDIFLNRRGGGVAQLTEISTGQRSALALSIFLSMNSSVGKKAPWLLFDDPIVHIDDLNVLSFLDSLRELVVSGGRQMFFATASSKVANLFSRKFDFLGDSFKEFVLERPEI